jgi:predicted MFS family arabinose efflux permease
MSEVQSSRKSAARRNVAHVTATWASLPVGAALAIVLGVIVGWQAALLVVAATIMVFVVLILTLVRKGAKATKRFLDNPFGGLPSDENNSWLGL